MKELQPTASRHKLQRLLDERKMVKERGRKSASTSGKHGALKFKQSNSRALPVIPAVFTNKPITANKQPVNIPSNTLSKFSYILITFLIKITFLNGLFTVKEQGGSDVERDPARVVCFPPARLYLPSDSPVVQVATGLHHTVLLLQNGQVTSDPLISMRNARWVIFVGLHLWI